MNMTERLTQYDKLRNCYVMKPDAEQGKHIQRLGAYEDRDTAERLEYPTDDLEMIFECGHCGGEVGHQYRFCPHCGGRLIEDKADEEL